MSTALRCLTIVAAIILAALLLTPTMHANSSGRTTNTAESILPSAANRDRAASGLKPRQRDAALAVAAHQHA